ncbi:UNVERIFIED_CONTAM: hypothetical protein Q9R58_08865 [Methylobacteriaceae bacterium AG10]|nr:hypothetical protein [Methylobacteriaceae bacterium AG10]
MVGVNDAVEDLPSAGEGSRAARVKVRCRTIEDDDLDAVVRLLRVGFPDRSEAYWRTGLERHRSQPLPDDVPRYGYVLERDGAIVGVLLALYRTVTDEAGTHLRCNLSSWYVLPEFRALGTLLDGFAMRDRRVTYTNVSPAPQTWRMHEARGFKPVCSGQMLVMPLLAGFGRGRRVRAATLESLRLLPEPEARLVADHIAYGCIGLVCSEGDKAWAVLFQRRAIKLRPGETRWPRLPCLQLVYRSTALDLPAFLGAIGRHLILRHAMPWFVLDAVGKLPGLAGHFFDGRAPKYARGPNPPATGDLTYTEVVLFGS